MRTGRKVLRKGVWRVIRKRGNKANAKFFSTKIKPANEEKEKGTNLVGAGGKKIANRDLGEGLGKNGPGAKSNTIWRKSV